MTKEQLIDFLYRLESATKTSVWTIHDLVGIIDKLEWEETNG